MNSECRWSVLLSTIRQNIRCPHAVALGGILEAGMRGSYLDEDDEDQRVVREHDWHKKTSCGGEVGVSVVFKVSTRR